MRNFLLLIISGFVLMSCQKELSFEVGSNPPPVDPGGGNPGGGGGTGGSGTCFTCDYSPICDGTKLNYIDSMGGTATPFNILYDVQGDSTVAGVSRKKIKDMNSGQIAYFNCTNNVVSAYISMGITTGGNTITGITQTPLKANEPVGATWKDILINAGQTIEYRYSIIEKNITRQVMDSTYSNVIYVRDTTVLLVPVLGEMPSAVRHSWFAKGIGQVEVRMEDLFTGSTGLVRKLKSYRIR